MQSSARELNGRSGRRNGTIVNFYKAAAGNLDAAPFIQPVAATDDRPRPSEKGL
jgi:hypothetical protein